MEQFHDGTHVWLRSSVHDTYVHADDDATGVYLRPSRASLHAAWAVHILHHRGRVSLQLHSAATGRYLAATTGRARIGLRGNLVTQRDFDQVPLFTVSWTPMWIGCGSDHHLLLRHTSGRFLRANGRNLRWNRSGVSVDVFDSRSMMTHWVMEAIPPRDDIPSLPQPPSRRFIGVRLIRFVQADPQGNFRHNAWSSFRFTGNSVYTLRNELARRMHVNASQVIMCVRAGYFGRLTPLVTDLPRRNVSMDIVILMAGTDAADELRHPNVDAA